MATNDGNEGSGADHFDDGPSGSEARFDPFYLYARDTEFRFIDVENPDNPELPILVELTQPIFKIFEEGAGFLPESAASWLRISPLYDLGPDVLRQSRFAAATVRNGFFANLRAGNLDKAIVRFELCAPLPGSSSAFPKDDKAPPEKGDGKYGRKRTPTQSAQAGPSARQAPAPPVAAAAAQQAPPAAAAAVVPIKVVVGVIDDGLAFANRRFRDAAGTGTRLLSFWGQDLPAGPPGWPTYGHVFDAAAIDALFTGASFGGFLDEDAVYRQAGLNYAGAGHKSWGRRAGHGTHVMDLAAGLNPDEVTAQSPAIVAIQLPVAVTVASHGTLLTSYALDGLIWILLNAYWEGTSTGANPLPCVVNLSYGTLHGPHDGTGIFAEALDEIITLWRGMGWSLSVVLPAGNGHLSQCHARVALPAGGLNTTTLEWRVLPDTKTPGFLEIWLPDITVFRQVEVRVTTPHGFVSSWVRELDPVYTWPLPGTTLPPVQPLLWVHHRGTPPGAGSRKRILIVVWATATLDPAERVAPSGVWRVELLNQGSLPLIVDAWIARNDTPTGYPILGRQSRFEDAYYLEHRYRPNGRVEENDAGGSEVMRAASLNGLATGQVPVVIGACRASDLSAAPYSAGGPTLVPGTGPPPPRPGPDALIPSDHSYARTGILAAGTRSGSTITMQGTSVAAPQMARLIAASMALGFGSGTRAQVAALALSQELARASSIKPAGPLEPVPPAIRGGSGRIVLPGRLLPAANRRR